jgi:hypothetical protein
VLCVAFLDAVAADLAHYTPPRIRDARKFIGTDGE